MGVHFLWYQIRPGWSNQYVCCRCRSVTAKWRRETVLPIHFLLIYTCTVEWEQEKRWTIAIVAIHLSRQDGPFIIHSMSDTPLLLGVDKEGVCRHKTTSVVTRMFYSFHPKEWEKHHGQLVYPGENVIQDRVAYKTQFEKGGKRKERMNMA